MSKQRGKKHYAIKAENSSRGPYGLSEVAGLASLCSCNTLRSIDHSMANLSNLPHELWIILMVFCPSPNDVDSLIKASPDACRCFFAYRKSVLKPHVKALQAAFGGSIPRAAFSASQLRRAKQEEGLDRLSREEAERRVRSTAISPHMKEYFVGNLGRLCALSTTLTEAERMTSQYAPQSWGHLEMHLNRSGLPRRFIDIGDLRNGMELSDGERRKFHGAIFRFENYCHTFFYQDEVLFPRDIVHRDLIFDDPPGPEKRNAIARFYAIVFYIYDQHWSLLNKVIENLGVRATPATDRSEADEIKTLRSCFHPGYLSPREFHLCRFRHRTRLETHKLVHYLLCQGVRTLLALQRMNIEDLTVFMVAAFYRTSRSHHPPVLMTDIVGHRKGIVGEDDWMPWLHIESVAHRINTPWRFSDPFWDRKRIAEERRRTVMLL